MAAGLFSGKIDSSYACSVCICYGILLNLKSILSLLIRFSSQAW